MKKSLCELSQEYFETAERNKKIIEKFNAELATAKKEKSQDKEKEIRARLAMMYEINRELRETGAKLRDYYKFSTSAVNKESE